MMRAVLLFLTTLVRISSAFTLLPDFLKSQKLHDISPRFGVLSSVQSTSPSPTFASLDQKSTRKSSLHVQRNYSTFEWDYPNSGRKYNVNYRVEGNPSDPPILLIHGFGANINHFRYNIPALVQEGYQVFAIDLLGFGASSKPKDVNYSIELWVQLICDFIADQTNERLKGQIERDGKWVVAGNSIGGLCSLGAAAKIKDDVKGCILFNCAGGMSIFRYEDVPFFFWPILYFFQKIILAPDGLGGIYFSNFKTRENVESILRQQVYPNTANVDEELLEILLAPSEDDGAKEVFLKVFGGNAGPTPESYLRDIDIPILALWGGEDNWTPYDRGFHPGVNFPSYCKDKSKFDLILLDGLGHCLHDEAPNHVHQEMIPWLQSLDVDD